MRRKSHVRCGAGEKLEIVMIIICKNNQPSKTYLLLYGRNAINPVRIFKYLLLKVIYKMSDRDLVKRTKTDLAFKFFLGMAPEEDVIHPFSLTKFRHQRLKDKNLLDMLIAKSVHIAIDNEVLKSKTIIVDATHTVSRFNKKSPKELLQLPSLPVVKKVMVRFCKR